MKIKQALKWGAISIILGLIGLLVSFGFRSTACGLHGENVTEKLCFSLLTSGAFQYMLEHDKESANYEQIMEYVGGHFPESKEHVIDWTQFRVTHDQKEIRMNSFDGVTYIYNVETRQLTTTPKAEPVDTDNPDNPPENPKNQPDD